MNFPDSNSEKYKCAELLSVSLSDDKSNSSFSYIYPFGSIPCSRQKSSQQAFPIYTPHYPT